MALGLARPIVIISEACPIANTKLELERGFDTLFLCVM